MEKVIEQLIIPILNCGRVSIHILLYTGQPSRSFDALAGNSGWQPWLGLLILSCIPQMLIWKSMQIDWKDIIFLCSFAFFNIIILAMWLMILNLFLRSSIELDELLLVTSIYYGPLFFWSSVLLMWPALENLEKTMTLVGLFKAGKISVWDVPKLSFLSSLSAMTASRFISGISLGIVWPVTYLMCSAAFCCKLTSQYEIKKEKMLYAM